ncbi:hypothetical protein R1flu_009814 [Riccia fluitans]|uniref:TF-B3 domain-containing protein n=1 Tax=Riccia fluitans TaxID=41844 RepID=A0ABD1Z7E1_9MARC
MAAAADDDRRSRSHQSSRLASKRARIEAHNKEESLLVACRNNNCPYFRRRVHFFSEYDASEGETSDWGPDDNSRVVVAKSSRMHSSTLSWRPAPSGCMSGTLNDVLMFTNNNRPTLQEMSEDKDVVAAAADRDLNSIEWQFLRDHHHALNNINKSSSAGRPAKLITSSDLEFRLPFGNTTSQKQQQHVMAPNPAAQWDGSPRNNSPVNSRVAVNYLGSFGPSRPLNSSTCTVDHAPGFRSTLDGTQLLTTTSCRDEVTDKRKSEEFSRDAPVLSSLILGRGGQTSAAHQLFGCGSLSQATATKGGQQQVNNVHKAAPNFRNLFPEQSSSLSSVLTQESLSGNDVNEHHPHKKQRRYDFIDVPGASGTLSQTDHHYRNSSSYPPGGISPLSNIIDKSTIINPAASFSPSLQQQEPERLPFSANNNSNSPLQNLTLSSFPQVSNSSQLPLKFSSNDTSPARNSQVDSRHASTYPQSLRTSSVPRGAGFQLSGGGGYKALNLMDGSTNCNNQTPNVGRDYLQSAGAMSHICSVRPTGVESAAAGRAAWPAGFINFPSAGVLEGGMIPGLMSSSRRLLLDPEHHHHGPHLRNELGGDDREFHRIRPISESQIRLVIQKQLTTTDVGSLGRIILPKKEAETHLPHLPDKEGIEMCLYDYDVDRTWVMKYRFWPNNKSRMYLLENTGEFAKYHGLQQGDLLLIYRQLPARYVLRVKKMAPPLRLVTPPRSINSESGGASAAEDLVSAVAAAAGTETVSPGSRTLSSSASSRTLSSSSAAAGSNLKEIMAAAITTS